MPRPRLLPLLPALALLGACGSPEAERPRGVVLISIDSLRADHLSCYGYRSKTNPGRATTPTIDHRLADEGVLFETAVSTTSWTLPAHMAMLTGKPDELHGVRDQMDRLHPDHELLQETFLGAGWRTAGFWSGPNLHPWFGFERGFELYADCSGVGEVDGDTFGDTTDAGHEDIQDIHGRSHSTVTGPLVVDAFEEWFDGVADDEPFFAFVHLWDVHFDYEPPERFDVFYEDYNGPLTSGRFLELANVVNDAGGAILQNDLDRFVSFYDGEILFTDDTVGKILGELSARGRLDDSLVVLTSDHGEEFFEHKQWMHKLTLYEESVRVPLILRWPTGIPAGERVHDLASIVDIAPTVLDVCGLTRPEDMWGRSLRAAWGGGGLEPRPAPLELLSVRQGLDARALHLGDAKVHEETHDAEPKLYELAGDFLQAGRDSGELAGRGRKFSRLAGDPRVGLTRATWARLDRLAEDAARMAAGDMPSELEQDLDDWGYGGGEDDEE